ncbi:hypothetical protein ACLMAB_28345 [Brevibacillus laterosporus]
MARALAIKPDLLLLDEPLSALDPATRAECQDELLRLHQLWNIPVLLVTHDEAEAYKLGNRILRLRTGRIEEEVLLHPPCPLLTKKAEVGYSLRQLFYYQFLISRKATSGYTRFL